MNACSVDYFGIFVVAMPICWAVVIIVAMVCDNRRKVAKLKAADD